jgi:hypothetical protein
MRAAGRARPAQPIIAIVLLLLLIVLQPHQARAADPPAPTHPDDKSALLAFRASLANPDPALATWNESTDPCAALWAGVICDCSQIRSTAVEGCAADPPGGAAR